MPVHGEEWPPALELEPHAVMGGAGRSWRPEVAELEAEDAQYLGAVRPHVHVAGQEPESETT